MKAKSKTTFFIVVLITAALTYLAFFGLQIGSIDIKGANQMRYGIDIRGGVEATYTPKDLGRAPTAAELDSAKTIIENRMDAQNITDREITVDTAHGGIIVRFPWKSNETNFDPQKAITELGATANLTFKDPNGNVVLQGSDVKKSYAELDKNTSKYVVILELNDEGAVKFETATGNLVGKAISIYMDETEISSPTVQEKISGGTATITGIGTQADAVALASKINSGALPFALEANDTNIITPSLGSQALDVMVWAGELAFILVCLFMFFYYRLPGFVACIALTLHMVGLLLSISIPQYTLTLPGIAGVILSVGMGVDANVIIDERIKEELNNGKTLRSAIEIGFKRAFTAVFDGNITVVIIAVILMALGSGSMKSFGYTLLWGVIMNFIAGVTASRLMISSLSEYKGLQKPFLFGSRRMAQ